MAKIIYLSILVNVCLCVAKVIIYVFTQSSLILTDAVDSLLNACVLLLNLYHPGFTPLINYSAIASYRVAYLFVSIDALVKQQLLDAALILLISSCVMLGVGIVLMILQILSSEFSNKKMVVIATINDNSSTLGAIISSSVGYAAGDPKAAGIIDNSLNLAICAFFIFFSVNQIIHMVGKDLRPVSTTTKDVPLSSDPDIPKNF